MTDTLVLERADGTVVCERCLVADRPWSRMRGLLGRRSLPEGEGILLRPASSVHMMFMRFPIDVVFVDRDLRVVGVRAGLKPWRIAAEKGAHSTIELAAGEVARRGIAVGDRLVAGEPEGARSRAVGDP